MADQLPAEVRVWYDAERDFLEVRFSDQAGFMRETESDAVMERVGQNGNLLGFSILNVNRLSKDKPVQALLNSAR